MSAKPYVCATGFSHDVEVQGGLSLFQKYGFSLQGSHMPAMGFLVSPLTLKKGSNPESRQYPALDDLPDLLRLSHKRAFTAIHINSQGPHLFDQLSQLLNFRGIYDQGLCHGVQFNMIWPPRSELKRIGKAFPELRQILQLSPAAVKQVAPRYLPNVVSMYDTDYVLIDDSRGHGIEIDVKRAAKLASRLDAAGMEATLGFAGGLSGKNIRGIALEFQRLLMTKRICVDTQTLVRYRVGERSRYNVINMRELEEFIDGSGVLL